MAKATKAEVVGPDPGTLVSQESLNPVQVFLQGLSVFLGTAKSIETRAATALEFAKATKVKSGKDDERAKLALNKIAALTKEAETHWAPATQMFDRVHKAFVAGRSKSTSQLAQARLLLTQACNGWAESERLRVERENAERLRVAEEEARVKRESELAELVRQALEAEAASPEVSARERLFADSVMADVAPYEAAKHAGYAKPQQEADRLMASAKIQDYIKATELARAARAIVAEAQTAPLDVDYKPAVERVSDARTQVDHWSAIITDARSLFSAIVMGHAPQDILVDGVKFADPQVRLNSYARSLAGKKPMLWAGVEFVNKPTWV